MKKNVLVLGAGRVGSECVQLLLNQGHSVTVVEKDNQNLDALRNTSAVIIQGNASDTEVLEQAGLDSIDEMLAVTGDVETNLVSCLLVDKLGYDIKKTLRVESEDQKQRYGEFVDNIIFPEASAARETIIGVDENFDLITSFGDNFNISRVTVDKNSPVEGKYVKNIKFPSESLVVVSEHEICSGDTKLEEGEEYLVVCKPKDMEDMKILFNG